MNSRLGDRETNLARAEELLRRVAGEAELACLPELFDIGYDFPFLAERAYDLAETLPVAVAGTEPETVPERPRAADAEGAASGSTIGRLRALASELELGIVTCVVERDPDVAGLLYDTAVLIDRNGDLRGKYRKSHLYPKEHQLFRPGDALPVFELDGLRVGIAICYELAFPQLAATLALQGAELILNPSAVPVGYGHLQEVRTRARAQDNQLFLVAVNHVGREGEALYCGESQVADPRGETLARASEEEPEAIVAELDLDLVLDQRRQEPVFRGSRPELYRTPGSEPDALRGDSRA